MGAVTLGPMSALSQAFARVLEAYSNKVVIEECVSTPRIECPCGVRLSPKSFRRHLRVVHGAGKKTKKWKRPGELKARR